MITSIVFSKNRPLQLDLTIASIKKNFSDCDEVIVLHNNDEQFRQAHHTLHNEHHDIFSWCQSYSLFKDVLHAIKVSKNNYICFFTDDDICFEKVPQTNYDNIFAETNLQCLSLRMGLNITERSHDNVTFPDKPKHTQAHGDFIFWSKTLHSYGSYWSYDLSVDGHIFRRTDMENMVDELCYLESRYKWDQTPNKFESALQRFWPISANVMGSFTSSKVVNSPNNRVQDSHKNRSGDVFSYDSEFLLGRYMSGARIKLDCLDFSNIRCPHTEIDLIKGIECYTN